MEKVILYFFFQPEPKNELLSKSIAMKYESSALPVRIVKIFHFITNIQKFLHDSFFVYCLSFAKPNKDVIFLLIGINYYIHGIII